MDEWFPIVNEKGEVIGKETRTICHGNSFLLHPVVHLHIFNSSGELYLQKRSPLKDIQPGKWDTAVGGHVHYGEKIEDALEREAAEELGIRSFEYEKLAVYTFRSLREYELVYSFKTIYAGTISPDMDEVVGGRFWSFGEIENLLGKNVFTPNFEQEFKQHIQFSICKQ